MDCFRAKRHWHPFAEMFRQYGLHFSQDTLTQKDQRLKVIRRNFTRVVSLYALALYLSKIETRLYLANETIHNNIAGVIVLVSMIIAHFYFCIREEQVTNFFINMNKYLQESASSKHRAAIFRKSAHYGHFLHMTYNTVTLLMLMIGMSYKTYTVYMSPVADSIEKIPRACFVLLLELLQALAFSLYIFPFLNASACLYFYMCRASVLAFSEAATKQSCLMTGTTEHKDFSQSKTSRLLLKLQRRHRRQMSLVQQIDEFFSPLLTMYLFFQMSFICAAVHSLKYNGAREITSMSMMNIAFNSVAIAAWVYWGTMVNEKLQSSLMDIPELESLYLVKLSSKQLQQALDSSSLYLLQFKNSPAQITVGGFLYFENTLIIGIFDWVLSYSLFLDALE